MLARDFCYWLQGHFEISGSTSLTDTQIQVIKNHLKMVQIHEEYLKNNLKVNNKPVYDGTTIPFTKAPNETFIVGC
jgi:hypothetical protein